jgi:translation initiation factor 1A
MPKNLVGGKKGKKKSSKSFNIVKKIELKDEDQEYAYIVKKLGNSRMIVSIISSDKKLSGKILMTTMRGALKRRRCKIYNGDIVLIALRSYQEDRADMILKYDIDEIKELKQLNEIPNDIIIRARGETIKDNDLGDNDDSFTFDSDSENETEIKETYESGQLTKYDIPPSSDSEDSADYDENEDIDIDDL